MARLDLFWAQAYPLGLVIPGHSRPARARLFVLAVALAVTTSGVAGQGPSLDEVTRLSALARTWGLLKYFHPGVSQGTMDWDATLVAAIPRIRELTTRTELNAEIGRLIESAGSLPRVAAGAATDQPETDPAFAWLDDRQVFEVATIQALKTVRYSQRSATNRYVKPTGNVANPDFSSDAADGNPALPVVATRLLALFRFWNMVQYYNPNRDVADRPWSEVLPSMVPRFIDATDATSYHLAVCELAASINDTHAVTSSPTLSAHWGQFIPPFQTRFIESKTVVTRVFSSLLRGADVRPGDVIVSVNGVATAELRDRNRKYMTASNEGSLQRNLGTYVMRTASASIALGVLRDGVERQIPMTAISLSTWSSEGAALDAAIPKWRMLPGNIGYVNMGRLVVDDVATMMAELQNTRAIVFDVRNYPNGTLYAIAERLNPARRNFVKFTEPRYDQPGSFSWTAPYQAGPSGSRGNYYRGRVIVLGDDRTQSHAEFTMMALRTAPDVVVVGSPTSGADGNVSRIQLPGGLQTYFSGLGVFYPDGTPTQRVGIVPDVFVEPTVRGIQAGVDEVLERALQLIAP
jgi:carboxyl-terminal processing protease